MMTNTVFEEILCESCSQPLFLDADECKRFIEEKLKQGYIVCSCCGAKQTMEIK
jgi:RNase P subunit RPR2